MEVLTQTIATGPPEGRTRLSLTRDPHVGVSSAREWVAPQSWAGHMTGWTTLTKQPSQSLQSVKAECELVNS